MKLFSSILPFCLASIAAAGSLSWIGNDQISISDDFSVPGKNPLTYCADPKDYILDIDYVDLDPNPPHAGDNLTITASGTFSKDVEAGAKIFLQVKFGLITLIKTEADLCDELSNLDLSCPLKKGPMNLTKTVTLPSQVPRGKYTIMADVYTDPSVKREEITCLEAVTMF